MIDVDAYRKKLEARLLAAGFTKLEKPVDTDEVFYVAIAPDDNNFDMCFWEPAIQEMLRAMEDVREFYCLGVYYDDSIHCLCVTASRGDNPRLYANDG